MIQQAVRPLRRRDGLSAIESLSRHWPEYLMEVAELGLYMVAICIFATLLQHPDSPVRHLIENALLRRGLMGAAMGMTIVTIILSPWGKQSGGHLNPAITITFYRLGKVEFWDLWFYVTSQFAGAALGVCVARYVLLGALNDRAVHYALTTPGIYGEGVAFAAEFTISLLLMLVILFAANRATLASYAPIFAGSLIAVYIAFETPLSGMSTNPARTFGSALHADSWSTLWIYFLAPTLGMLVAGRSSCGPEAGWLLTAQNSITPTTNDVFSATRNPPGQQHESRNEETMSKPGRRINSLESARPESAAKQQPEQFDLVILGGGTGATLAAWTFAGEGQRVAVIDRKYIGGSCPNIACLPSKNIIHSAKVASYVRHSDEYGISRDSFVLDMSAVRDRKRNMVSGLNEMYLENYEKTGAELIFGSGRFVAPRTIEVTLKDGGKRQLSGTNVIISTGTHASLPPIPGLADSQPLTHIEALELDQVPAHLLVIGGGYVGVELSQAMRRFGARVTVIDPNQHLLPHEDEDACHALRGLLEDEGIEVALGATVKAVSGRSGQSVNVVIEQGRTQQTLTASHILVAAGRIPNTDGLALDLAGVELTDRAYIKVNERLQTTAPGVWAIGEVAGSPQFTHISVDDFRVVHANLSGGHRSTTGRQVPYCLFTDPELARVGLSEKEAQARDIPYRLFKVAMDANLRARTLGETRGFMKALVESNGDRILGFTALGVGAGEMIGAVQIAMIAGLPYTALRDAVLTHPTLVEGLTPLFSSPPSAYNAKDATTSSAA